MSLIISKLTRTYPHLPYEKIKNKILSKSYSLSLTFIGEKRAHMLNKEYRNADYTPSILSFTLSKKVGEIYITPIIAKKEAKKFNMNFRQFAGFLFIHALLHLKGYSHGDTMERVEKKNMKLFDLE